MTFKERVTQTLVYWVVERPAKRQGLNKLVQNLRDSGEALQRDLERIEDKDNNRDQLRHIIAIEKWGQRRLRVALGEPFVEDENHAYKPNREVTWVSLKDMVGATRAETLNIAGLLERADVKQRVPHNQFGPLTVLAWLRYLETHARLEGKRLR
jgi:hypothetical protein